MPLEMFDGKTGVRLIARLPVEEGSVATVVLVNDAINPDGGLVTLTYVGAYINGYPALTPTNESLRRLFPEGSKLLEQAQKGLVSRASEWKELAEKCESAMAQVRESGGIADALTWMEIFFIQWQAENASAYLGRMSVKRPICPRIMPGHSLIMRLPKVYGALGTIPLGTVESISIHNAEPTALPA